MTRRQTAGREIVAALEQMQDSRCAGCGGVEFVDFRYPMVIDHCHDTGLVRGLLCLKCNRDEGHGADRFAEYRAEPPAVTLGIKHLWTSALRQYRSTRGHPGWQPPSFALSAAEMDEQERIMGR